jgi:hypothetical protein
MGRRFLSFRRGLASVLAKLEAALRCDLALTKVPIKNMLPN